MTTDIVKKTGSIFFIDCFAWPKKKIPLQIDYNDIDTWLFEKIPLNEVLCYDSHYHLYFDFDSISSEEDYQKVLNWLDSLTETFGPYTIGGYTNSETLAEKTGLRYYPEGDHFCSIHTIYYTTKIKGKELQEIMKYSKKGGFEYNINEFCDPNVYKLESRQLFRHALSNKISSQGDPSNKLNHGNLLNNALPSQHVVQIKGDEKEIPREVWSKVFQKKIKTKSKTKNEVVVKEDSNARKVFQADDFEINENLIILSPEELLHLLNHFDPVFDNFEKVVINLFHSPYEKEVITDLVKEWYFQDDDHHNMNTIDQYSDQYYEKVVSNKWFFSILKHLDYEIRKEFYEKYSNNNIDEEAKVDLTDSFSLFDIRKKNYRKNDGIRVGEFLSDLKKVLVVVDTAKTLYFIKDTNEDGQTMKFSPIDHHDFENKMKSINLGYYMEKKTKKTITAYQVYSAGVNKNIFMKKQIRFFTDNDDFFNVFHGYLYQPLEDVDMPVIQPFLNHIKDIIADKNEELYEFILNWVSYIIQNPNGKTETAIVLTGKYGTGKNTFTNAICQLLKGYSVENVNKIDNIVGKNNSLLENKKLIICNELSSADSNQFIDFDTLKSIITETSIIISEKYQPSRASENVVNLIFVSNHDCPIQILKGDRRYVVSETSAEKIDDKEYWKNLEKTMTYDKFYPNLFTYFVKRNISDWDKRVLPHTAARERIINNSKSPYEMFIAEYLDEFKEGWSKKGAYAVYKNFAKEYGFREVKVTTFNSKIDPFCLADCRVEEYGKRARAFKLKRECVAQFEKEREDEYMDENPNELLPQDI